ncbi:hypothetical protein DFH09DRAFT_1101551 [Mycena vulgaris]|nr:hypothetical protein DFH09DRAFT_1101551 [Mycena vulgaris]
MAIPLRGVTGGTGRVRFQNNRTVIGEFNYARGRGVCGVTGRWAGGGATIFGGGGPAVPKRGGAKIWVVYERKASNEGFQPLYDVPADGRVGEPGFMIWATRIPPRPVISDLIGFLSEEPGNHMERIPSWFFPRLTDLQITIIFWAEDGAFDDGANPKTITFFHALATSPALPPTLKNLAISWNFGGEDQYEKMPPVDESDFARLCDALLVRCPTLTSLWFDGHEFFFRWRKGLDGTVNETTAEDFEFHFVLEDTMSLICEADMVQSRLLL